LEELIGRVLVLITATGNLDQQLLLDFAWHLWNNIGFELWLSELFPQGAIELTLGFDLFVPFVTLDCLICVLAPG